MKTNKRTFAALAAIAAANPEGYTVDAPTLAPVTYGSAVAVADTQNSFGPEGLARVIGYVANHDDCQAFGGWYNKDDGQFYFDATIVVFDKEKAIELARRHDQKAFYCIHEGKTYDQDGNEID